MTARTRTMAVICGCTLLFVLLRCIQLEADPPERVFGFNARELFAEPPAKSHEARNYAVFGSFKLSPHDSYQFWRAQSPLWVYPLALWFSVFGADYPQLRIFSTLYAAAGLALLLVIGARLMRPAALAFVGLTIALDAVYFHTARVGFIEPAVSAWLTLSILALLLAERRATWLCLALVAFTCAFFTKQGALFVAPVVVGAAIVRVRALDPAQRSTRALKALLVGTALVLLAVAAIYIATTDYARTAVHNLNHLALGHDAPVGQRVEGIRSILLRVLDVQRYQHLIATVPVSGPIAFATALVLAASALRDRRWPSYPDGVVLAWYLCAVAAMCALANSALRFWTVLIPPATLLAGIGLDRAYTLLVERRQRTAARWVFAGVFGWLVAWNGVLHVKWLAEPQYSVRDASRALEREIGDVPAIVIGTVSPWVVLGTPYRNYYVRPATNSEPGKLRALGVTHLLSRDLADAARELAHRDFPGGLKTHDKTLRLIIRSEGVTLFEITRPKRPRSYTASRP